MTQAGLARVSAPPSRPPFACSHTLRLWRALGAEQPMSHRVLAVLLGWLQKRPLPTRTSGGSPQPKKKAYLHSLAVSLCPHHPTCRPSCLLECVQSHMGVRHPLRVPGPGEGEPHTQPGLDEGASEVAQLGANHTGPGSRPSSPLPDRGPWTPPARCRQ